MQTSQLVLLGNRWRPSTGTTFFHAFDPSTANELPAQFPISPWLEIDAALDAAVHAFEKLSTVDAEQLARFLEAYADGIDDRAPVIVESAHRETALPMEPRLLKVELPRTTNQLRFCAKAARDQTWRLPTIDRANNIRSMLAPIGPVAIFGPNNFPLAFNSISGGDFAAAIAAGNPVIAKAHPCHPNTCRLLAEVAFEAATSTGLPPGTVQLLYGIEPEDGLRLVADPRVGAVAFTGSRKSGLELKRAADLAGIPIYLELGSVNPVIVLPGALRERGPAIADEFKTSALMGCGQFCTNPGLLLLIDGPEATALIDSIIAGFKSTPPGKLFSPGVLRSLQASVAKLQSAGAELMVGGQLAGGSCWSLQNTLLRINGQQLLDNSADFQTEAFGNASLVVVCRSTDELLDVTRSLEGNLTGTIYSSTNCEDDASYARIEPILRRKVGRLIGDKMPTGVAVSPAMHHGGPYPAAWHPVFSAVGPPGSLRRFSQLQCFDGVRQGRLPQLLRD